MIQLSDNYYLDTRERCDWLEPVSLWVIKRCDGVGCTELKSYSTLSEAVKGAIDIMLQDAVRGANGQAITDLATLAAAAENYRKTITEKLEGKI